MRLDVSFFVALLDNFQQFRMLSKEEIEKMKVLLRLMTYLRPSTRWVVLSVSLLILGTLIDLTAPWLLKEVFDKGIAKNNTKAILLFTLLLAGIQVVKSFGMFVQGRSQELVGQNVVFTLRKQMYEHLQRLSFGYYEKQRRAS